MFLTHEFLDITAVHKLQINVHEEELKLPCHHLSLQVWHVRVEHDISEGIVLKVLWLFLSMNKGTAISWA